MAEQSEPASSSRARVEIANVLATRYASAEMAELWSPRHKVILERRLWIAVLEAQRDAGVEIPDGALEAYRAVIDWVDLASITARERVTRHDVKARIEEFCALAGHEQIHRAMTSRDLTENVEQCQVRAAMELVTSRLAALIVRLGARADADSRCRDDRPFAQRACASHDARQALGDNRHRGTRGS